MVTGTSFQRNRFFFIANRNSVACAIRIQKEFENYNQKSAVPVHVRIGLHAGEPVAESDDLFGSTVQLAARICDIAQADAILVSRAVRDACAGADLIFESMGSKMLKGFSDPIQLFSPARV